MKTKIWNRCEACGKFVSVMDIIVGLAFHDVYLDEYGNECDECLCKEHYEAETTQVS